MGRAPASGSGVVLRYAATSMIGVSENGLLVADLISGPRDHPVPGKNSQDDLEVESVVKANRSQPPGATSRMLIRLHIACIFLFLVTFT